MSPELEKSLYQKYPAIFQDNTKSIQESCMAWGICVGDGWYGILDALCSNIQNHTDQYNQQCKRDAQYNLMREQLIRGDCTLFDTKEASWYSDDIKRQNRINQIVTESARIVQTPLQQVVAEQVKEKFGGLRFYYRGGDSYISGLVAMAESMSYRTCDVCGNPGTKNNTGWIRARCEQHAN
jgi:hypothetical protein